MRILLPIVITIALLVKAWRVINIWPEIEAPDDGAYMSDDEYSFVFNTN
jgi:hypothetical protein